MKLYSIRKDMVNSGNIRKSISILSHFIGISLSLFLLYYAYYQPFQRLRFANLFLGFGLMLFYLGEVDNYLKEYNGTNKYATYIKIVTAVLFSICAIAIVLYVNQNIERIRYEAVLTGFTSVDYAFGLGMIIIVTDATYRAYGKAIASVVVGTLFYGLYGPLFPGILEHSGLGIRGVIRYGGTSLDGVWGFILGVGVTWVAIYILFAGMAQQYGALDILIDFSDEISKKLRSGVVEVAIISSMIMGSITGSAAANTATTGSFTIPMLKNQGVKKDFAAAIESVASSGGQMLPPVMGVAAFLMADILGIPYVEVLMAGTLPAVLFYLSIGIGGYLLILKYDWTADQAGSFDRTPLVQGIPFLVPLSVLLYTLIVLRYTPLSAGFYTILSIIGTMYIRNIFVKELSLDTVVSTTIETLKGFTRGMTDFAPLIGVLASMGVIITIIEQTGLPPKISFRMLSLAGGIVALVLIFAMIASILFGLGMPTPAAYLVVVILVAPSLTELGLQELTSHMFVFYFAMLSAITPPVAIAVAVGSQIASSNFLRSCKQALRLGAAGFIIPFVFVWNNSLIYWSYPQTIIAFIFAMIGVFGISSATIGHNGLRQLSLLNRVLYVCLAGIAFFSDIWIQIIASLCIVLITIFLGFKNFQDPIRKISSYISS